MQSLIESVPLSVVAQMGSEGEMFVFSPVPGVLFTEYGMELTPGINLNYDEWRQAGESLACLHRRSYMIFMWGWGDWLNKGESNFGEAYAQAMSVTGLREKTLINYKYVANATPRCLRGIKGLTQRHYLAVGKVKDPKLKLKMLVEAAVHGWTASRELPLEVSKHIDEVSDTHPSAPPSSKSPPPATLEDEIYGLQHANSLLSRSADEWGVSNAWLEDTIKQALTALEEVLAHIGVVGDLEQSIKQVISTLKQAPRKNVFEAIVGAVGAYRDGNYSAHAEFMTIAVSLLEE